MSRLPPKDHYQEFYVRKRKAPSLDDRTNTPAESNEYTGRCYSPPRILGYLPHQFRYVALVNRQLRRLYVSPRTSHNVVECGRVSP